MFVGYVSDENYLAVTDLALDFGRGSELIALARSSTTGAVHAEVVTTSIQHSFRRNQPANTTESPRKFRSIE